MNFIDSDQRRRLAFVEHQMAATTEILKDENVQAQLGLGLVDRFRDFTESFYVPDIVGGQVRLNAEQRESDGHPVVAVKPGETIVVGADFATLRSTQRQAVAQYLEERLCLDGDAEALTARTEATMVRARTVEPFVYNADINGATAATIAPTGRVNSPKAIGIHLRVSPRPLVALSMHNPTDGTPKLAELVHEGAHVFQRLDRPVMEIGDEDYGSSRLALTDEHQAYGTECRVIKGRQASGYPLSTAERRDVTAFGILDDMVVAGNMGPRWADPMNVFYGRLYESMKSADENHSLTAEVLYAQRCYA